MTDETRESAADAPPSTVSAEPTAPTAPPTAPQPPTRRLPAAAIVVLAIVVVLAASLAFAPVRTMAGQLLSIFRVQKIATVSITQDDIAKIGQSLEKGDPHVSLQELGDVWMDGKPNLGSVEPSLTTLAKAQAAVDFPIVVPSGVEGSQSVLVQPGSSVKFKLNVEKVNALLQYYGASQFFSSSLDGKTFEVKMPPTVFIAYGKDPLGFTSSGGDMMSDGPPSVAPDPTSQDVFVVQTRGPELIVPDGVNALEIRDVLLNLPFLPSDLRSQLSGVADWQHTLLIPNLGGSTKEISVAGNPGVLITQPQDPAFFRGPSSDATGTASPKDPDMPPPGDSYKAPIAVMWHQNGILRAVATTDEAKSLKIAESMAR